jgi:hypothetical protein
MRVKESPGGDLGRRSTWPSRSLATPGPAEFRHVAKSGMRPLLEKRGAP